MAPDLKPCPFCGSKPTVEKFFMPTNSVVLYSVQCNNINCPVNPVSDYCKDRAFIIKQWNRRAEDA